jgi:hypothetical protein
VPIEIRRLSASEASALIGELSEVLVDCVEGGASVSFLTPFGKPQAEEFFHKVIRGNLDTKFAANTPE